MRFHLPRPLHGWREFAGEVAIIVLGVLIALGAEQVVESFHEAAQLRDIEARMTAEMIDDDLPQAFARAAIGECNSAQIDQIETAVAAGDRHKLSELANAYQPPFRSWDDEAWKAALASDALTRGDAKRMIGWSTAYLAMPILTQWTTDEQARLPQLRVRMSGEGELSPDQKDRLFQVAANLRVDNAHLTGGSQALLAYASRIGLALTAAKRSEILDEARRVYGACVTDVSSEHGAQARAYDAPPSTGADTFKAPKPLN